jgi:aspartate kinase
MLVDSARKEIEAGLNAIAETGVATWHSADAIASHGEGLSSRLLTIVLEARGLRAVYVAARRCLVTDEEHGNARPLIRETLRRTRTELMPLLRQGKIPVLEGFVGVTRRGATSTMGRGSSNYTATLVSAALDACETQIWTDVNGVLTADPSFVKRARTIPALSYGEAIELAHFETRVLHPRMMQPALEKDIPVFICNSRSPHDQRTLIYRSRQASPEVVKAITRKTSLAKIDVEPRASPVSNRLFSRIKAVFDRYQTQIDFVVRSKTNISVVCCEDAPLYVIAFELQQFGRVRVSANQAIVSCVGEGLRNPNLNLRVLRKLREIEPSLSWQKTSALNLATIVKQTSSTTLIKRLHGEFFGSPA